MRLTEGRMLGELLNDGFSLGLTVGKTLGLLLGTSEGNGLGFTLGSNDGSVLGNALGPSEAVILGNELGKELGMNDGIRLGSMDGMVLGTELGSLEGALLGDLLGTTDGSALGSSLGSSEIDGLKLGLVDGLLLGPLEGDVDICLPPPQEQQASLIVLPCDMYSCPAWLEKEKLQSVKLRSAIHVAMSSQSLPLGPTHSMSFTQALGLELGTALGCDDKLGRNDGIELGKKLGFVEGALEVC